MDIAGIAGGVLRSVAPTLLTAMAIPPPFGLLASGAVSYLLNKYLPPGEEPAARAPNGAPILSNEQIVRVVESNVGDKEFLRELRLAEADLKRLEAELPFKFEQLAQMDRDSARKMAVDAQVGDKVFDLGLSLLRNDRWLSYGLALGGVSLLVASGYFRNTIDPMVSNAIFTLIGLLYGKTSARADQVTGYYFGSSQGSKNSGDAVRGAFDTMSKAMSRRSDAAAGKDDRSQGSPGTIQLPSAPVAAGGSIEVSATTPPPSRQTHPETQETGQSGPVSDGGGWRGPEPLAQTTLRGYLPGLIVSHRKFDGSVFWKVTPQGVMIEGSPEVERTAGRPATVERIWREYGQIIKWVGMQQLVPVELIVATIATESGGKPNAYREEPKISDASSGLMQTLTRTATEVLGRKVSAQQLFDPETSLLAGVGYISKQAAKTNLDPVLVAAAYNSGGLYLDNGPENRWKLRCYPIGTGKHIDNFVRFFNDAMAVSADHGWGHDGTVSFVTALKQ